jgi:hypothetical protein
MIDAAYEFISEPDFEDEWGARTKPGGDLFIWSDVAKLPSAQVWTVYEEDDVRADGKHYLHWYATPGIVASIALGYLVTEKPWEDDTPNAIWYRDDDELGAMERYRATHEAD